MTTNNLRFAGQVLCFCLGVTTVFFAVVYIGLTLGAITARQTAPIVCGDPLNPSGIVIHPIRWPKRNDPLHAPWIDEMRNVPQ